MKISCFGVDVSFGYNQVGGTDSFFRRLGLELAGRGHEVEFVHYGCACARERQPAPNLVLKEFASFGSALRYLAGSQSVILVNAVRARDRPRFMLFRQRSHRAVYMVYSLFAATARRRRLHFLEAELYPYRPGVLCLSPRLVDEARRRRQQAHLILPPVPPAFFDAPRPTRPDAARVVTYIGRLEEGKGAVEAITTLERLAGAAGLELRISAYAFKGQGMADVLAERAQSIPGIRFVRHQHDGWSPAVETALAEDLARTDFLLLPYRDASCSIDVPLLLLEGMANRCCILTRPIGEIQTIYGDSPFIVTATDFAAEAATRIRGCSAPALERERSRIAQRNCELAFDTPAVATKLLRILESNRNHQ